MTRIEALTILDLPADNLDALKKSYRKAALRYHPDHGGDVRQMQLVNQAMTLLSDIVSKNGKTWGQWHMDKASESEPLTEQIKRAYDTIKHLPGIIIELCGSWLWISGDTKAVKSALNSAGCRWNNKKKLWYWRAEGYRKRTKKQYSINEIRSTYGSMDLETDGLEQIAA